MLEELRKKSKLSREKLAFLTGTSVKTIYRIEQGDENVRYETLKKFATFFECEIKDILKKD